MIHTCSLPLNNVFIFVHLFSSQWNNKNKLQSKLIMDEMNKEYEFVEEELDETKFSFKNC